MSYSEQLTARERAEELLPHCRTPERTIASALLAVADAIEAQTLAISQLFPMTDGEGTPIVRTWPFEPEPTDPADL